MTLWERIARTTVGDDYAAAYARRFQTMAERGEDIHGEAGLVNAVLPPPARVLDAGCGTGRIAVRLHEQGYDAVGVDVDLVAGVGPVMAEPFRTRADLDRALAAGADVIVAQGTEAGGHTGQRATLPLLQEVLATTDRPVLAAGGVATGAGLAAVLVGLGLLGGATLLGSVGWVRATASGHTYVDSDLASVPSAPVAPRVKRGWMSPTQL